MPSFSAEDGWLVASEVFIISSFNPSRSFSLHPLHSSHQDTEAAMPEWTPSLHGFWQSSFDAWKWQLHRAGLKWMIELSDWLKMCCGLEDLMSSIHLGDRQERECVGCVFVCVLKKKPAVEMWQTPRAAWSGSFLSSASFQTFKSSAWYSAKANTQHGCGGNDYLDRRQQWVRKWKLIYKVVRAGELLNCVSVPYWPVAEER